jgi:FkbM family methyltransferase
MIPLSKKAKQVIAYEANPEIFPLLQANVMLNKCKNITVFNYAVGDDKKEVEFYLNRVNSGGSKIKPKIDQYMYHFDNPKTQVLSMICLDDHIEQEQLPSPDVVVMDIEGSEYYALKGMKNTLKNVNCLHIEYIPHHLKNVAGVSNQQFLECLLPYFDKMKVLNESIPGSEKEYQKDEFQKVLDDIEATDDNSNLLLYKS